MTRCVAAAAVDSRLVALLALLATWVVGGCATWSAPEDTSVGALRARAVTEVSHGVRISAAVLGAEDNVRMLGTDIAKAGMRAVWVEVENRTSHVLTILRSGTDPDYFSPLEVAWTAHMTFGGSTNARIDEHFDRMAFDNPIPAGETHSGLLFVNPQPRTHVLNVDLLGNRLLVPFTLFLPVPGDVDDLDPGHPFHTYAAEAISDCEDLDALRTALQRLPCCAANADGAGGPAPINLVLVGSIDDVAAALARRGYRRSSEPTDEVARLFDRAPGIVAQKRAQAGAPAIWLRIWRAPLNYQGQSVFAVQAGRPVGGRFLAKSSASVRMHPDVDEVRGTVILDAFYSAGLARVGFVSGAGTVPPQDSGSSSMPSYVTDGLRTVLMFVERPLSLDEIDFLDWEPYPGPEPTRQGPDADGFSGAFEAVPP